MKEVTNMEEMSIFKSYLRQLLRNLHALQEARKSGDDKKVDEIIENLIKDTQNGLED